MFTHMSRWTSLALVALLVSGFATSAHAQSRGGGGRSRSGAGVIINGGGIELRLGSPSRGGYYGGGYGPRYVPSSRGDLYGPSPRLYITPEPVTRRYVPPRNDVYSTPAPAYVPNVSRAELTSNFAQPAPQPQPSSLPGVSFGDRAHLVELADAVAERTNLLCMTLHQSYSANANFKEVYRDTYLLITAAKQLRESSQDPQLTLVIVNDMNAILEAVSPTIESWRPTNGGTSVASSQLSSVASAVKLLSIDAGWEAGAHTSQSSASFTPQTLAPAEPTPVAAPSPDSIGTAPEPTPIDPVPVP